MKNLLLYWLMKEIQEDTELVLQIVVTGMHLSPEFGLTFQQIEADGFKIDAKVETLLSSDTSTGIAKSIGFHWYPDKKNNGDRWISMGWEVGFHGFHRFHGFH